MSQRQFSAAGGVGQLGMRTAGLFITGTDTGVGKTHLTCFIAREMRAAWRELRKAMERDSGRRGWLSRILRSGQS